MGDEQKCPIAEIFSLQAEVARLKLALVITNMAMNKLVSGTSSQEEMLSVIRTWRTEIDAAMKEGNDESAG